MQILSIFEEEKKSKIWASATYVKRSDKNAWTPGIFQSRIFPLSNYEIGDISP